MGQMITLSDAELIALMDDLESDRVERKESWAGDAPEKGRQAVCAFANDLPDHNKPGVLFVGVRDDGSPSNISVTDELLLTLADIKTDGNTLPPPTTIVQKRVLKGADVAVVLVQPADAPPVKYRGRTWIRIGPRRGIATAQDERILNERRRHRDLPFDIQPVTTATMADLDRVVFEEYLLNAVAPDILQANDRTFEQRLAACRMISGVDDLRPTILGLLVLGKRPTDWLPGAYIQFLRIRGTELSHPIIDEEAIGGTLGQLLRRIDDKLSAHNRHEIEISSGPLEKRTSNYPMVALQQLIRNAVLHRTYENTNSPIRMYWFDDRIEIFNPGGLFGLVTKGNFGKPGFTDYRNPHLADAMRVLGFVQHFGVGIQTARSALAANGNPPPEFEIEPNAFLCKIGRQP